MILIINYLFLELRLLMMELDFIIIILDMQKNAKLTLVSATSIVEGGAHDVLLKDNNASTQTGR